MHVGTGSNNDEEKLRQVHSKIFRELIFYCVFLAAVTTVSLLGRSSDMFYFYDMIQKIFVSRPFPGQNDVEIDFEQIATVGDWWGFMTMAVESGIPGQSFNLEDKSEHIRDNILLGPPRLRKLRVKNGTCLIHDEFKKHFRSCYGAYSLVNEDTKSGRNDSEYKSSSKIDGLPSWGKLSFYRGGGYIEDLTFDHEKNKEIIEGLIENMWIDRGVRLVVFEFALYNANVNLFSVAKFLAEIPPTGGVIPSYSVYTYKLTFLWTNADYIYFIFYGLFIVLIVYFSVEEVIEMHREKAQYFTQLWNWVDLFVIVIGYLSLAYVILRFRFVNEILQKYRKDPNKHLNLDVISFLQFNYNNMMAICAFLVWIKVLKYLSFNRAMIQFSETLRRCSRDLLAFGLMFTIAFLAFAQMGYLLFGTEAETFKNFADSLFTMMRTLLGDFEYSSMVKANRVLGPIFFLLFIIFVFFILLNMFLAIINDTYSEVKAEETDDSIRLGAYIKTLLGKMCMWCCCGRDICGIKKSEEDVSGTSAAEHQPKDKGTAGQKKAVQKYFEVVDRDKATQRSMDTTELNKMNQRIERVEDILDRVVVRLDALVSRLDSARVQGRGT